MSKNKTFDGLGASRSVPQGRGATEETGNPSPAGFNPWRGTYDEQSMDAGKPEGGKPAISSFRFFESYHVPVAFVAKDWNVTPRRIRALLASGRLEGRLLSNGYWEVLYPYMFTFGTRGPSLKRQQRPPKRPKPSTEKPELKAV